MMPEWWLKLGWEDKVWPDFLKKDWERQEKFYIFAALFLFAIADWLSLL